ncbi:hypothetical protein Daud_1875 [Candidatus Desulforudis audaxviator MP104C]|uniref:Uncharacterized protein n=1 Tax=Desulforudis audaxviator (strain MP104C) TaxID=477974 RepID=B1I5W0_DESAP|nr:hypothetical protein Daud_1875 [Candidatus Desulforudis audaxviator MP104C]
MKSPARNTNSPASPDHPPFLGLKIANICEENTWSEVPVRLAAVLVLVLVSHSEFWILNSGLSRKLFLNTMSRPGHTCPTAPDVQEKSLRRE